MVYSEHMKAVIFAAGEGKRMQPLTLTRPKPLVEVLGKPLIQHVWEALPSVVDEVVVVVGYKQEMIQAFLGNQFLGKRVTYVVQDQPLGTGHALNLCREHILHEEKFLLMYADDIHGAQAIESMGGESSALLVSEVSDPRRFGVVECDERGFICGIEEKPEHPRSHLAAVGVYVLSPKILSYGNISPKNGEYYLTDMIAAYINDVPVRVVRSDFWIPIAYPEDVLSAEEILRMK